MNRRVYYKDHFLEIIRGGTGNIEYALDCLLKNEDNVSLSINDDEDLFRVARSRFHYIEAAGGLIEKDGKFLFILRHGKWDLPKGKLEIKENPDDGAIRECVEECGVSGLRIIRRLPSTFHIYEFKKGIAFKQTFWYYMQTSFNGKLQPQASESIERAEWFTRREVLEDLLPGSYGTIADLVRGELVK